MNWFGAPSRPWQRRQDDSLQAKQSKSESEARSRILREISGRNQMSDDLPPSQCKYPYGLGRPEPRPEIGCPLAVPPEPPRPASRQTQKRTHEEQEDELRLKKRKLLNMDDWTGASLRRPLDMHFAPLDGDAPVWGWGEAKNAARSPTVHSRLAAAMKTSTAREFNVMSGPGNYDPRPSSRGQEPPTSQTWAGSFRGTRNPPSANTSRSLMAQGLQNEPPSTQADNIAVVSPPTVFSIPSTPLAQRTHWDKTGIQNSSSTYQERFENSGKTSSLLYSSLSPQTHGTVLETPQSLAVCVDEVEAADIDVNNSTEGAFDFKSKNAVEPEKTRGEAFAVKRLDIRSIPDYTDDPIEEDSSDQELARHRNDKKKAAAMFRPRRIL